MTIKSLFNWSGFGSELGKSQIPIDRWHGNGGWHHKAHGHSNHSKGGSGGNAVLSALALLAFLFLLNVMQQSLRDNNSTASMGMTTALLVREENSPILLTSREDKTIAKSQNVKIFGVNDENNSDKRTNQMINKDENS